MTRWGATEDEWVHFDWALGLGCDLLPVVSNPGAKISSRSTIKKLGKTPSLYNSMGEVVGISKWTDKKAIDRDIAKWSKESDYGICLQTRRVRALDVDVTDPAAAARILDVIERFDGRLAVRVRGNSPKFLVAFTVATPIYKRVLPVKGGAIELLGTGQQFIAAGTHDSGVRYEWQGCDLGIELSSDQFEMLWDELVWTFAVGAVTEARPPREGLGDSQVGSVDDEIIQHLNVDNKILSRGRSGEAFIECPWKGEHTLGVDGREDAAGTSTAYFPAGTGGYDQGHFRCLHAHCSGRSDWDFKLALGIVAAGFDVVEGDCDKAGGELTTSGLGGVLKQNDDKQTLAVIENVALILNSPEGCGRDIRYDVFRDEIVYKPVGRDKWLPFTDVDYTELRIYLANTGFLPISHDMMQKAVHYVAKKRMFDTAIEWISGLEWDGVNRVKSFLVHYLGAESNEYNLAVAEYMWTAMAGRILEPGCKADAAPIFIGDQFIGKTYAIMSMVPDIRYYCEINFEDKDDDLARKMRGKMVAEFAEMRGFQGKDSESTKAFISRQFEEWTPKYMEFVTQYFRRLVFIGTSNKDEIFTDETGNRREFPVKVVMADCDAIKKDREQLWAEGAVMFKNRGIEHYYRKANTLASGIREEFMITDAWDDDVKNYLITKDDDGIRPIDKKYILIDDVIRWAIGIDTKNKKTYEAIRVGKILRKYGLEKKNLMINGSQTKVWIPGNKLR